MTLERLGGSTQHPGGGCHTEAEIASFLAFATESYDVGPKRVYLTGLSCGAIGAWSYLGVQTNEVVQENVCALWTTSRCVAH